MKLWAKVAALGVLACFATVYAQNAVCSDLVQQALTTVDTACAPTGRNQACYGNISLAATARDGVPGFSFDKQGDLANVADVASLQLEQLDLTKQIWGIALMKVQANLPDTLPGQNVTFLLFGDVKFDNAGGAGASGPTVDVTATETSRVRTGPAPQYRMAGALAKGQTAPANGRTADSTWLLIQIPGSNATGWVYTSYLSAAGDVTTLPVVEAGKQEVPFKPMQAFYFTTGIGKSNCAAAPDSGILIQTPKGAGQVSLSANDVDIQLGSTAYLQAEPGDHMTISVVEGQGKVSSQGKTVTVPAGMKVEIPIDQDMKADGEPGDAQPYDAAALANLPISLLPLPITIVQPVVTATTARRTPFPTWTRRAQLPAATLAQGLAPTLEPSATATYDLVGPAPTATYGAPEIVVPTDTDVPPPTDVPPTDVPAAPLDNNSHGLPTPTDDDGGYMDAPLDPTYTPTSGVVIEEFIDDPTPTPTIDPEMIA